MKSTVDILEERISAAMTKATGQTDCAAVIRPATDPRFGDYQANGVMSLAKQIKTNPRKLAETVVAQLDLSDLCEPPEVAGPGFINLRLKPQYVATELLRIAAENTDRLGIRPAVSPQTIVVDFSSPNVAKQMHVGHLRSTIIGDCLCRLLEFEGHRVTRQNHIGDWGTQFGMLIAHLDEMHRAGMPRMGEETDSHVQIVIFEEFYRQAKKRYDEDAEFAGKSRSWVVKLQNHDPIATSFWRDIVAASLAECQQLYETLGVTLAAKDARGESSYNDDLPTVIRDLKANGLAVESEGAVCVFPPGFQTKEGEPLPFIIQKSDGAFLYATTDLAALRYRINVLKADRIVYVTDARQIQHFQMLFKVAEMAGWDQRDGQKVELVHVTFGSVLGEDGKPLKTRSGENVKLRDLLDEAVERATTVVEEKNPELSAKAKSQIAQAVGIGAVKYADYCNSRTSDYVFSFDKMLAMEGNTAPYMQYAYARVRSIERKAQTKGVDVAGELASVKTLNLSEPSELDLAKHLVRYAEAVESAIADYRPNYLTAYLYELAQRFSTFYTNCPVLDAPPASRPTRLLLCDQTARTIGHGLAQLLGIAVVEQM
ncbi:MAG: arginine--tRNA ligase [Phycisphaerae bacterium]|nr:arginine--tRNA ligase [Phycisphaerae bacterium]